MKLSLRKRITAIALTAAMAVAMSPAAALAAPGDVVDEPTRTYFLDLYDSSTAFLSIYYDKLPEDVRVCLECARQDAYAVINTTSMDETNAASSELRVALRVAESTLAGIPVDTNVAPDFVIGTNRGNVTRPMMTSWDIAGTIGGIYADNRGQSTTIVRQQVLGYFVDRIYLAALGRTSDDAGRAYWVNSIMSGERSANDVIITILQSQEFMNRNLSDEAFVTAIYKVFFGRNPDTQGLNTWVTVLRAGTSRADLVEIFTTTAEWQNLCSYFGL